MDAIKVQFKDEAAMSIQSQESLGQVAQMLLDKASCVIRLYRPQKKVIGSKPSVQFKIQKESKGSESRERKSRRKVPRRKVRTPGRDEDQSDYSINEAASLASSENEARP